MHALSEETIKGVQLIGAAFDAQTGFFSLANHVTGVAREALEVGVHVWAESGGESRVQGIVMKPFVDGRLAMAKLEIVDVTGDGFLFDGAEKGGARFAVDRADSAVD